MDLELLTLAALPRLTPLDLALLGLTSALVIGFTLSLATAGLLATARLRAPRAAWKFQATGGPSMDGMVRPFRLRTLQQLKRLAKCSGYSTVGFTAKPYSSKP